MPNEDPGEEIRSAWQQQATYVEPPTVVITALRTLVRERALAFRRRVLGEYAALLAAAVLLVWVVVRSGGAMLISGAVLLLAGQAFGVYRWHRTRADWWAPEADVASDGLQFYKNELVRMRDLHRSMWKNLPPVLPGLVLLVIALSKAHGRLLDMVIVAAAIVVWMVVAIRRDAAQAQRYELELMELHDSEASAAMTPPERR